MTQKYTVVLSASALAFAQELCKSNLPVTMAIAEAAAEFKAAVSAAKLIDNTPLPRASMGAPEEVS